MTYYSRKSPRIPYYDYSCENFYFVTICTHNRRCLFGSIDAQNRYGKIAEKHIQSLSAHYDHVRIDKYVVMPNHIHMIVVMEKGNTLTLEQIIGLYKSGVSREIQKYDVDFEIWQRSFHDHIIRNQASYEKIWLYIEGNPQCWNKDCFYIDQELSNR